MGVVVVFIVIIVFCFMISTCFQAASYFASYWFLKWAACWLGALILLLGVAIWISKIKEDEENRARERKRREEEPPDLKEFLNQGKPRKPTEDLVFAYTERKRERPLIKEKLKVVRDMETIGDDIRDLFAKSQSLQKSERKLKILSDLKKRIEDE